ncbi:hypothetical protein [Pseudomonas sp. BN414]|uniref:hypothetical protein n=1 Tax=Pseudomonas sp. BN414 TaxID=2567888 RepID=UPI0024572D29|nr:hypothetical protein [Pseudomonas sp. BN414]
MRKQMLLFTCLFYQLVGCSELPAPTVADRHVALQDYCPHQTDAACAPPMHISLGDIFR